MPTRILIADDERIQCMDLKDVLTKQGYLVVGEAYDGLSAVNLARALRPDLAILDIRMPEMDGIAAAEILTQEKIAPVVLLTAYGDRPLIERAVEAGVFNYIVKPLRESEVTPAIEVPLARYNEFRALEEKTRSLIQQLETRELVEHARGLLMEKQGLSGQEAFRKIQKASINSHKSMREIAEAILLAYEMETSDMESQSREHSASESLIPPSPASLTTTYLVSESPDTGQELQEDVASLFAIARTSLEEKDQAFVGKPYFVEASISRSKPTALAGTQNSTEPIWFDIVLHSSDTIELIGEWQKRFNYDPGNPDPQLIGFIFRAVAPGSCSLAISFYHERRWLRTIKLAFDAIEHSTFTISSQGG